MNDKIKKFFIKKGFSTESAEFIEEVVDDKFKNLFFSRLLEAEEEVIE